MARPRKLGAKEYKEVEKLARLGLTIEMISNYLEINPSTAHRDETFCKIYKKCYTEIGAKTRINLIKKAETDITANIYLDKVLNKTSEKHHDDSYEIAKLRLELEREKADLMTEQTINIKIVDDINGIETKR